MKSFKSSSFIMLWSKVHCLYLWLCKFRSHFYNIIFSLFIKGETNIFTCECHIVQARFSFLVLFALYIFEALFRKKSSRASWSSVDPDQSIQLHCQCMSGWSGITLLVYVWLIWNYTVSVFLVDLELHCWFLPGWSGITLTV